MSAEKHTPGPWAADGERFVRQVDAPRHVICRLPYTNGQRDQLLIAAAPDLLEALQAYVDAADEDAELAAFNKCMAAIAKATGVPV